MLLHSLSIDNFKNIEHARLTFSPKINGLLGFNGMGKSNLLDAIYALSFTKSFCGVTDAMLLRRGEDFAIVRGEYLRHGVDEDLTLGLARGRRKSLKRKGKEYQRISEHIGVFPLVMISPADEDLVRESADERRRWMDMCISQSDALYLDSLMRYLRGLEQRNRLLREGSVDHHLYSAIESMMEPAAEYIHDARAAWVSRLEPLFAELYRSIADTDEAPTLRYVSHLDSAPLGELFDSARRHDEMVRHTSVGPHRDDIELGLNGMPMRRTGSQGQIKTFVIALRLAQYEFLSRATGLKPLLLLDDVFDKLDARRVERIMELVCDDNAFGQIFITDTNRSHLDEIMARMHGHYRLWEVTDGSFTPLHHEED